MSNITEQDERFKENMGGFFHDLLRASGITMLPTTATSRIRSIGEQMASAIEHAAERKSIQVIQKLQKAISIAFVKMEAELNIVKELVSKHNAIMENLLEDQKRNITVQEELKNRIEDLEYYTSEEESDSE